MPFSAVLALSVVVKISELSTLSVGDVSRYSFLHPELAKKASILEYIINFFMSFL
jgi:hypothetical protein